MSQLFILPYSGASVDVFSPWRVQLASVAAIELVDMAGRGKRRSEPTYTSFEEAVEDITTNIMARTLSEVYAIFGHSMGALLAYFVCRRLELSGRKCPKRVYLSGRTSPQYCFHRDIDQLSDAALVDELLSLGCPNVQLYTHPRSSRLYLSRLRADYRLASTFVDPCYRLTETSGVILYGRNDPFCEDIASWNDYFQNEPHYCPSDRSHYYVLDTDQIIPVLKQYVE
jgi:surfactin synthase thioesterase subunit